MISKIKNWIINTTPYWVAHILVAVAISLITGYWLAGFIFYLGREIAQYEESKIIDWKGALAPLIACLILKELS